MGDERLRKERVGKREYSMNNVDMQLEFGLKHATCGEWEPGIFFTDRGSRWQKNTSQLFLDLRTASVNVAIYPIETEIFPNIMSYIYWELDFLERLW